MNPRTLRTTRALPALAAAIALWMCPVRAPAAQEAPDVQQGETLVTLSFPGGTLGGFVEALKKSASGPVNVILRAGTAEVPVEEVHLRSVEVGVALEAVADRGLEARGAGGAPAVVTVRRIQPKEGLGSPVYVVERRNLGGPSRTSGPAAPDIRTEVFSIAGLVDPDAGGPIIPVGEVLSALETAAAIPDAPAPRFRFHEGTRILVVSGTAEQIRAVQSALVQMQQGLQQKREEVRRRAERAAILRERLENARAEVEIARARLEGMSEQVEELRALAESGDVSRNDVRDAEIEAIESRAELGNAEAQFRRVREELARLEGGTDRPVAVFDYDVSDLRGLGGEIAEIIAMLGGDQGAGVEVRDQGRTVRVAWDERGHALVRRIIGTMKRVGDPSRRIGDAWVRPAEVDRPRDR